jgi:hypothetical protein
MNWIHQRRKLLADQRSVSACIGASSLQVENLKAPGMLGVLGEHGLEFVYLLVVVDRVGNPFNQPLVKRAQQLFPEAVIVPNEITRKDMQRHIQDFQKSRVDWRERQRELEKKSSKGG